MELATSLHKRFHIEKSSWTPNFDAKMPHEILWSKNSASELHKIHQMKLIYVSIAFICIDWLLFLYVDGNLVVLAILEKLLSFCRKLPFWFVNILSETHFYTANFTLLIPTNNSRNYNYISMRKTLIALIYIYAYYQKWQIQLLINCTLAIFSNITKFENCGLLNIFMTFSLARK